MYKIDKIKIKNYKSIEEIEFKTKKLNIIIGKNDSGKSNILEALNNFSMLHENFKPQDACYKITDKDIKILETAEIHDIEIALYFNDNVKIDEYKKNGRAIYYKNGEKITDKSSCDIVDFYNHKPIDIIRDIYEYESGYELRRIDNIIINNFKNNFQELDKKIEMENICNTINYLINKCWSGKENKLNLSVKTNEIKISVNDIVADNDLSNRGTGFQLYIYMVIQIISKLSLKSPYSKIISIEEPERMLHPQAQRDFIKTLEEIMKLKKYKDIQFFITTHSPVIVNYSKNIEDTLLLLVKKNSYGTTKIIKNIDTFNYKNIREELGISISDTLLFGQTTLIVEGDCEHRYIKSIIKKINEEIDVDRINIINAGGADKISAFYSIVQNENSIFDTKKVVVLVDGDKAGSNCINKLISQKVDSEYIVQLNDPNKEVAFEDIFSENIQFEAIKHVYGEKLKELNLSLDEFKSEFKDYINTSKVFIGNSQNKTRKKELERFLKQRKIIRDNVKIKNEDVVRKIIEDLKDDEILLNFKENILKAEFNNDKLDINELFTEEMKIKAIIEYYEGNLNTTTIDNLLIEFDMFMNNKKNEDNIVEINNIIKKPWAYQMEIFLRDKNILLETQNLAKVELCSYMVMNSIVNNDSISKLIKILLDIQNS